MRLVINFLRRHIWTAAAVGVALAWAHSFVATDMIAVILPPRSPTAEWSLDLTSSGGTILLEVDLQDAVGSQGYEPSFGRWHGLKGLQVVSHPDPKGWSSSYFMFSSRLGLFDFDTVYRVTDGWEMISGSAGKGKRRVVNMGIAFPWAVVLLVIAFGWWWRHRRCRRPSFPIGVPGTK